MSPLARSLLALGALLAAADAKVTHLPQPPGAKCGGVIIDITSKKFFGDVREKKFNFTANGNEQLQNITDHCGPHGMAIASQTVKVCNDHVQKVPVWYPPKTFALGDEKLSPVYAACDPFVLAAGDCGELHFHITQKCRYGYKLTN